MRIVFSLSVIQLIVVPREPLFGEARHLENREDHCSSAARANGKDIQQTVGTRREHEVTIDTLSIGIVDTSDLAGSAGGLWSESSELGTVGGRQSSISNNRAMVCGRLT